MYLDYWGLTDGPFENTPDPRFLFPARKHCKALERMLHSLSSQKGCALLTGGFGCGKSILLHSVLTRLEPEHYDVAFINYPIFDEKGFLREILYQFGKEPEERSQSDLFRDLSGLLYENDSRQITNLLVLDEAQLIREPAVFEQIRLLLNLQRENRFLLHIFIAGQPELSERIREQPGLEQRIAVKSHLEPFDREETAQYIHYRLKIAGCSKPLFTSEAIYVIFKISGGIPRDINNLCDLCLLEGAHRQVEVIEPEIIKLVI